MGLLDDAIREHLELKRRRGADPGEVAREQREALAAVPRDEPEAPDDGGAADGQAAPASADGTALTSSTPAEDDPAGTPKPTVGTDTANAGETAELDMRSVLGERESAVAAEPPPAGPAGTATEEGASEGVPVDEDSLEWEVPGEVPGEHAPERTVHAETAEEHADAQEPAEDVLEETPDFLRDTPEQDRLWFEQRPPRDFDFDK